MSQLQAARALPWLIIVVVSMSTMTSAVDEARLPNLYDPPTGYSLRCSVCYSFVDEALRSSPKIIREHGAVFGIADIDAFVQSSGNDEASSTSDYDEGAASAMWSDTCREMSLHYGLRVVTAAGGAPGSSSREAVPVYVRDGERTRLDWVRRFFESTCEEYASKMHPLVFLHALQGKMTARHFADVYCELCQLHNGEVPLAWGVDVQALLRPGGSATGGSAVTGGAASDL